MADKNTIRFAVGTQDDIRSSIWRFWSNKNDLYLAARSFAAISKFSFHESGQYRFAVNSTVEREDDTTDRAIYKWRRPDEYTPGWTRCFNILVPPRITRMPFDKIFKENKDIMFVEVPTQNKKIIFDIILSHKAAVAEHLVRDSTRRISILGKIEMAREIAWLVSYEDEFNTSEEAIVKDNFDKLKIHIKKDEGDKMKNAFLHAIDQGAAPFLIDIELGKENLDISEIS